jgi:hypothetical protein
MITMLKKNIFAIITFLLLMNMVSAVENSYLTTTLMKYEPQPAEPGKYVKVYVKLQNNGTRTAENVVLQIIPTYPFSLDIRTLDEKYIGLLGGKSFHVAEFDLKVDENAVQGTNTFKVRYNIDSTRQSWAEQELSLTVQSLDAVLAISKLRTEPKNIVPGSIGSVKIELENLADSYLTDIKVELDLSSNDIYFAPYNSASQKNIYQLATGEKKELSFDILAFPDAEAQVYKIPIDITYYDNMGTEYTLSDVIGVIVNSEPDVKVTVDSTDILKDKMVGSVTLKIVNKGFNNIKFLNLKITPTDKFDILSASPEEYVGNLDSDDYETVEFTFLIKDSEEIDIPLKIEYYDPNNNFYEENLVVRLKIHSSQDFGENGNGNTKWIIALVIIAMTVFFYIRKKRKKTKS